MGTSEKRDVWSMTLNSKFPGSKGSRGAHKHSLFFSIWERNEILFGLLKPLHESVCQPETSQIFLCLEMYATFKSDVSSGCAAPPLWPQHSGGRASSNPAIQEDSALQHTYTYTHTSTTQPSKINKAQQNTKQAHKQQKKTLSLSYSMTVFFKCSLSFSLSLWDRVSLCSWGLPWSCYKVQANSSSWLFCLSLPCAVIISV